MKYQDRVNNQLKQYAEPSALVKLPKIYHYWMQHHVIPKIKSVFHVNNALDFYVDNIIKTISHNKDKQQIFSVGSGDCKLEVLIAKRIQQTGFLNFTIECSDISQARLTKGIKLAEEEGVINFLSFEANDINSIRFNKKYSIILAHHSLHHIVELEKLIEQIKHSLTEYGRVITIDMIGRNGHMRWPEALNIIEPLWAALPERYKFNHQFKTQHTSFINWDCSTKGFEGIRSQDILPLLLKNFAAESFFAYGNLIDVFVERGYGHNFDVNLDVDLRFIDFVELLNNILIESGYLKPTMMWAVFGRSSSVHKQIHYKNRSAEFCIRQTND